MSNETFDVHQGNGRLYKLEEEKKQKEIARLTDLRKNGQKWATDDKCHAYDGFMQVGQDYINWLQEGLNQSGNEVVRMNWKAYIAKMSNGSPCMHIKGVWFGNGMPDLKKFIESGANVSAPQSAPAPQKTAAPVEDFLDDDLPF